MDKYKLLIDRIARQTKTAFGPASSDAIHTLRELKFPEAAIQFYARYAPTDCAEGQIRLWPIDDIVVENTQALPGIGVHSYGYTVFASTLCGDAYCFNANKLNAEGEPEIILISHETVGENSPEDEVHAMAKPVAASLAVFLDQFTRNEVDEECIY